MTDIQQRIGYLGAHPERWRAGWLLWMIAALSLASFYAWWGSRLSLAGGASHAGRIPLIAFSIAALGLACDFAGESIFIGWIPHPNTALHRVASLFSGAAGNGFYTIAGILLTIATPSLPFRAWAWLAWASGIALTIFTIANVAAGVVISSGALMILFIPWVFAVGVRWR